jgi:hypothetical protein
LWWAAAQRRRWDRWWEVALYFIDGSKNPTDKLVATMIFSTVLLSITVVGCAITRSRITKLRRDGKCPSQYIQKVGNN